MIFGTCTWCVNDGQVWAILVLNLDHNLFGPELLLPLKPPILILNIVLHPGCDNIENRPHDCFPSTP